MKFLGSTLPRSNTVFLYRIENKYLVPFPAKQKLDHIDYYVPVTLYALQSW